jgi:hypothetical protein
MTNPVGHGWQAEAPAPHACKAFVSGVEQTLSSVTPVVRPIFSPVRRKPRCVSF